MVASHLDGSVNNKGLDVVRGKRKKKLRPLALLHARESRIFICDRSKRMGNSDYTTILSREYFPTL